MRPVFQLLAVLFLSTAFFPVIGCQNLKPSAKTDLPAWATNDVMVTATGVIFSPVSTNQKAPPATATGFADKRFKDYDEAFISTLEDKCSACLELGARPYQGKTIVLRFHLNSDGTITDLKTDNSKATPEMISLCEKCVLAISPYKPWPAGMRQIVGHDSRMIYFTVAY